MKQLIFMLAIAASQTIAAQSVVTFLKTGADTLGRDSIFRIETQVLPGEQYVVTERRTLYLGVEAVQALFSPQQADIAFREAQIAALQAEVDGLKTALAVEQAALNIALNPPQRLAPIPQQYSAPSQKPAAPALPVKKAKAKKTKAKG